LTTKRSEPSWREFERMVAMIEESAVPQGAAVKSPDRIRDLTTGEMREVDASIRFRLGTVEILITIECQRRSRKANDTWIEQLATKKQKLGAARTIAVSKKGFTRGAHLTAEHHGIELRRLSEVTPQDVKEWLLPRAAIHVMPVMENMRCLVRVQGGMDYIELGDVWERRFFHDQVVSPFPAADFWAFHEMAYPRRFLTLPRDGSITKVEFEIDATKSDLIPVPVGVTRGSVPSLLIDLDGTRKVVTDLRLIADVSINVVSTGSEERVYHAYEGTAGPIAQHARFKGEAFGLPVTFDLAARGDDVSGIAEFPSGARIKLGWVDNIPPSELGRETCAFCNKPSAMGPQSVLPDFLLPLGVRAKERFLCSGCTQRFEQLDSYAAEVWRHVPEDFTVMPHGAFSLEKIDGNMVRLWLLSLVWRMGMSQALRVVDLGEHAPVIRELLYDSNPGQLSQYPAACIALSCEGKRARFFFPPQWSQRGEQRILSIVLDGVLFNFLVGTDTSNGAQLVSGETWVFPILDWWEVDFLVDAVLKKQGPGE
jgi:hypothetical protein